MIHSDATFSMTPVHSLKFYTLCISSLTESHKLFRASPICLNCEVGYERCRTDCWCCLQLCQAKAAISISRFSTGWDAYTYAKRMQLECSNDDTQPVLQCLHNSWNNRDTGETFPCSASTLPSQNTPVQGAAQHMLHNTCCSVYTTIGIIVILVKQNTTVQGCLHQS